MEHAPSAIELPVETDDEARFIAMINNAVRGACALARPEDVRTVKIDNWFGEKWFNFSGKAVGALGVPGSELHIPPFHPNRVVSERYVAFRADGTLEEWREMETIHPDQTSASNLHRSRTIEAFADSRLFAWYSGRTIANGRGSLMVYAYIDTEASGWYVELIRSDDVWIVSRRKSISMEEWSRLIESGRA